MQRIYLRFDADRAAAIEQKRQELGLRSVNDLFLRLWDAAGPRLQRDGLGAPADRPAQAQQ